MNFSVVQQKHNKPAINHEQMQVRSVINYAAAKERLRTLNIRATGPRVILASLLFSGGNRHVTAEMLHGQAIEAGMPISLATVYNTLRQFVKSGLINVLTTDRTRRYFDTDRASHCHFLVSETGALLDIPTIEMEVSCLRETPADMEITRIEVMVRLRRKLGSDKRPTEIAG